MPKIVETIFHFDKRRGTTDDRNGATRNEEMKLYTLYSNSLTVQYLVHHV